MISYCRLAFGYRMDVHRPDLSSVKNDLDNHYNAGEQIRYARRWDSLGTDMQIKDTYVDGSPCKNII